MHAVGKPDQKLDVSQEFYRGLINELICNNCLVEHEANSFSVLLPSIFKDTKMFDVKSAPMSELVAKYNELVPDKPVKKFADRATAEKRLVPLLPKTKVKTPKAPKADHVSREDQRMVKHGVTVDGVEYRSVLQAFQTLNLPIGRHIGFRGKLKTSEKGRLGFEYDGVVYDFRLMKQKPAAPKKEPKAKKA
jgi:hypothetical protein